MLVKGAPDAFSVFLYSPTEEAETCVRIDGSASTKYIHSPNYPANYEP